jgi:hypothetical protein
MASLRYVGGNSAVGTGATYTVSLTGLSGGLSSTAAANDIVVVIFGYGANANITPTLTVQTTGYTYVDVTQRANDTRDAVGRMAYKVMGSTPDTSVVTDGPNNAAYGGGAAVQVWRYVDTSSPTTGTGSGTSGLNANHGDPPAVTPAVNNAVIVCGMTGSTATTAADTKTGPTNYTTYEVKTRGDGTGSDCYISINARILSGGSGASQDPGAYSGGTTSTSDGWTAFTVGLAPGGPVIMAGSYYKGP